jgi:hypothetical protein
LLPSHRNPEITAVDESFSFFSGGNPMARSLTPFTRLTLLISELKGSRIEDLADTKKCDLAHHTAKLHEEIADAGQKETAVQIGEQGKLVLSLLGAGDGTRAETERQVLLASCKGLKDLL